MLETLTFEACLFGLLEDPDSPADLIALLILEENDRP